MKPEKLALAMALVAIFSCLAAMADEIHPALTVEQAYQAIPHQRTAFDGGQALMSPDEKQFLALFFQLTDLAVIERVSQLQDNAQTDHYAQILSRLAALQVPPALARAHRLVTEAVSEQQAFLDNWKANPSDFDLNAPLVNSSHAKLIQAYGELMRLYPQETAHNKQAFFDHLCSLDFK